MNMNLIDDVRARLDELASHSLTRQRRTAETPCAPRQVVDGRRHFFFLSRPTGAAELR